MTIGYTGYVVRIRVKAVKIGNSIRMTLPRDVLVEASIAEGDILLLDYDRKSKRITVEKAGSDSD